MNAETIEPPAGPRPGWIFHVILFVLGLLLGSPLVIQSWNIARSLDPVRKLVADQRAQTVQIIQKVIRD